MIGGFFDWVEFAGGQTRKGATRQSGRVGLDPCAAAIVDSVPSRDDFDELRCAVLAETDQEPNVDFATAAIVTALDLSDDAPIRLSAVKGAMGWLAHAIEQMSSGSLVRPRVRYVGPKVRRKQASDFGLLP